MNVEDVKTPEEILEAIKEFNLTSHAPSLRIKYNNKLYRLISVDNLAKQYLLGSVDIKGDPGFWVDEKNISWSTNDLN